MTTMTMIKSMAVASLLTLAGCATQSTTNDNADWPGYRTDGDGNLLKTADGRCWRTPDWSPAMAVPECDVAITGVPEPEPVEAPQLAQESAGEAAGEPVALPAPLTIEFAFDSATISEVRQADLKSWYQQVAELDSATVEVNGYSDPLGDTSYNRALAQQRAEAVAQWWLQQGQDIADLTVVGHGPDRTVSGGRCDSLRGSELKQCHQQDRRVVLQVNASFKD
ncbi:OmpA family protein [Alcanivorax sp. S6407]|uniref:OmpA family protein n=1 Tax=Alcanivorax sp. S6407 TaxID=2926424 RepID=UPI001FF2A6CF|nr:OmpA family protein [Alcanivorax sp. S6407]MCK0154216.1 OmpA family protein [Alcanivorax sp. S6407]